MADKIGTGECGEILIYQTDDGKTYNVTYYNLDMIISLGYRIKSVIATRFRQWATQRLKEYMSISFHAGRRLQP